MTELLSALFTGVVSGGATGLLGIVIQRWFDLKKAQQDRELLKLQLEAQAVAQRESLAAQERMASKAAELQALQEVLDLQAREIEAAAADYRASIEHDRATYSTPGAQQQSRVVRWLMAAVDFARGIIRPGVTLYSLGLLTLVLIWVQGLYTQSHQAMSPQQIHDLTMQCVGTVFYLVTTTTVWWFGVRPAQPPSSIKR